MLLDHKNLLIFLIIILACILPMPIWATTSDADNFQYPRYVEHYFNLLQEDYSNKKQNNLDTNTLDALKKDGGIEATLKTVGVKKTILYNSRYEFYNDELSFAQKVLESVNIDDERKEDLQDRIQGCYQEFLEQCVKQQDKATDNSWYKDYIDDNLYLNRNFSGWVIC